MTREAKIQKVQPIEKIMALYCESVNKRNVKQEKRYSESVFFQRDKKDTLCIFLKALFSCKSSSRFFVVLFISINTTRYRESFLV